MTVLLLPAAGFAQYSIDRPSIGAGGVIVIAAKGNLTVGGTLRANGGNGGTDSSAAATNIGGGGGGACGGNGGTGLGGVASGAFQASQPGSAGLVIQMVVPAPENLLR